MRRRVSARACWHCQDPDGQWAGGAFFPAGFDFDGPEAAEAPGTLDGNHVDAQLAARVGARCHRSPRTRTAELLAANSRWEYEDLPYWDGEVDCCINAWTVSNGVWLGADVAGIVDWFVEHRLADGGWNCEWVEGSTRSSFHSTLNALKGLLDYDVATGGTDATRAARHSGEEYLLTRSLFRRLSTGQPVAPWVDHFTLSRRGGATACSTPPSTSARSRCSTARHPTPNGRRDRARSVPLANPTAPGFRATRYPAASGSTADVAAGEPSKWLTLFGIRVLDWWDAHAAKTGCDHACSPVDHGLSRRMGGRNREALQEG